MQNRKETDICHGSKSWKALSFQVAFMSNCELVEGGLLEGGLLMYLKTCRHQQSKVKVRAVAKENWKPLNSGITGL